MKYVIGTLGVILAALLGVTAASCGAGGGARSAGSVPTAEPGGGNGLASGGGTTAAGAGSPTSAASTLSYQVWLTRGESLFEVTRRQEPTARVGTAALEALLQGPTGGEQAAGVGSQVPTGTQLLGLTVAKGVATVDLTSEYEAGGGSASMNMRIAQIVYTLTQFPTVKGVLFELDGRRVDVLGGEGVIVDHPVSRKDYRDLLPVILVRSPEIGQAIRNPVTVSGSANVFEANVTVAVMDADGKVVGQAFTTATCGTGCRGTFSVTVGYSIAARTRGLIVVHDDDAAGTGTPPHEVRIPVVLTPSS